MNFFMVVPGYTYILFILIATVKEIKYLLFYKLKHLVRVINLTKLMKNL